MTHSIARSHEFWISLGLNGHERAVALAGGELPLALRRARDGLKFWAERLANAELWLQTALDDEDAETLAGQDRVARQKVDCTYYAKGEHEARQHLERVERQAAERGAIRPVTTSMAEACEAPKEAAE